MEREVGTHRRRERAEHQMLRFEPDTGFRVERTANPPPLVLRVLDHARAEIRVVVGRRTGRYRGDTGYGGGGNGCEQFGGRSHLVHTTGSVLSTGTTVTHSHLQPPGECGLQWTGDFFRAHYLDA